jgi:hypothetical protein
MILGTFFGKIKFSDGISSKSIYFRPKLLTKLVFTSASTPRITAKAFPGRSGELYRADWDLGHLGRSSG